ncbi:DedA family protein [Vibrio splendidus]|uniref:DedA family protein n=1 Tax=Vibrio splendidus TaxID=29497 RepID=UPI00215920F4|nr:VTT domain-containing protein [Vibrio splendidus]
MLGIIALSYLLEDLAIVTAAGIATQGLILPQYALLAIFIGIATGDLGLYYLGKSGRYFRGVRYKALTNKYFRSLRTKLRQNAFSSLFVIRFIPGLRTVGFTLSGFFAIPLPTFLFAVIFIPGLRTVGFTLSGFFAIPLPTFLFAVISATAIWTGIVFSAIYYLGTSAWLQASEYQWIVIPCAIALLFIGNRLMNKTYSRGLS